MATHNWLWIGNRSLLDPSPTTNITQAQANAAVGWVAEGADQLVPTGVTANLQAGDIGYRTTYQTLTTPTRIATPFSYTQPITGDGVTGMTARTFVGITLQVRQPLQDGSGGFTTVNKSGVLIQMSNGDVFIRPSQQEINSWDDIPAISRITITSLSPYTTPANVISVIAPVGFNPTIYQTTVVCFTRGTRIRTMQGTVCVEDLSVGDIVWTRDHGPQAIRWLGCTKVPRSVLAEVPSLRPIRISSGALGAGIPATDLVVSPQHRVVVRSKIAQRMFGTIEILIAAKHLLAVDGVDIVEGDSPVEYFHFLLDQHSVVDANGTETESLFVGPQAMQSVGDEAREELLTLFPMLRDRAYQSPSAIPLSNGRRARQLALRHAENRQHLVR